ncbi:MAG: hypothetical protein ABIR11_11980 [Candidatus Limnocylindrales bacterium]
MTTATGGAAAAVGSRTERGARRWRTFGLALVVAGLGWMTLGQLGTGSSAVGGVAGSDLRYGVGPTAGDPGIAIHWIVCPGETARMVDLEVLVGGSRPAAGVPILWQIRSVEPRPVAQPEVLVFTAGQVPPGWYETIPLARPVPADLLAITAPPGDGPDAGGRSFDPRELQSGRVERGGYESVTTEQFVADGLASCGTGASDGGLPLNGLGLVLLGLGGVVLSGRSRPVLSIVAAAGLFVGGMLLVEPFAASTRIGADLLGGAGVTAAETSLLQGRDAFAPGTAPSPAGRTVLLDLSSATARLRPDGQVLARFIAPGDYAFLIGCSGPSLQLGELAPIPNGVTGARQLVGCSTPDAVRSAIADDPERGDAIELLVNPAGSATWRVVAVAGDGATGPFAEP